MKFKLLEMAMTRADAIDRCIDLGLKFSEDFDKIYREGIDSSDFEHHCSEMRGWLNSVRKIVLKSNGKKLLNTQIFDWFLTAGTTVEELFSNEDEINKYDSFISLLLFDMDATISDLIIKAFGD